MTVIVCLTQQTTTAIEFTPNNPKTTDFEQALATAKTTAATAVKKRESRDKGVLTTSLRGQLPRKWLLCRQLPALIGQVSP